MLLLVVAGLYGGPDLYGGPERLVHAQSPEDMFLDTGEDMGSPYPGDPYSDDFYSGNRYGGRSGSLGDSQVYIDPVLSVFKGIDLASLLTSKSSFQIRSGPALEAESKELLSAGNFPLACQLMYGHMAAEFDEAQPAFTKVKWSSLLKRPVWSLRWAVSFAVRGGEDITDPSPIQAGGAGRFGGYGPDDMEMEDPMDFQPRRGRNRDISMDGRGGMPDDMDPMDDFGNDFGRSTSRDRESENQTSVPPMLSPDTAEQMEKYLGGVAEACAAEFDKRFAAGDFGSVFVSAVEPAPPPEDGAQPIRRSPTSEAPVNPISPETVALLREVPPALPMWRPGLIFLGQGNSSDMSVVAKANDIDLLLHFDITLKQQGRQTQTFVQNVSRARLIHVATGKSMIVSKAMDSMEVQQLQTTGRLSNTDSYIEDQMSNLWRIVDREAKLTEMPKLSPESARRRIGSLLESGGRRNLRTLAEIRLYQSLGLIEPAEAENAYDIVGGSDALTMVHGPREERLEMARTWAIESLSEEE
jgi:hypothetical protein